jgi:peptidoglycan/LPS O-acetylase OafA/YrhL
MNNTHLRGVDAARGLAAGFVLIHHLDVFFPVTLAGLLGNSIGFKLLKAVSSLNSEAVMLFFVISGFCIQATSRKYVFSHRNDLAHYGLRRAARIFPPYLIAIAFTFAVGFVTGHMAENSFSFRTLVGNLLFLQSPDGARGTWFVPFGDNAPLWSLSFEVFYYVIFPATILLEAWLPGDSDFRRSLTGLSLTFVFCCLGLLLYQVIPNPILLFVPLYFVWRIGVSIEDMRVKQVRRGELVGTLLSLAFLMAVAIFARDSATLRLMLFGTSLAILWLIMQGRELSWLFRLSPIDILVGLLAWVGTISYSLYLLHYPILQLTKFLLTDSTTAMVVGIGTSVVAAAVVEPTTTWIKRQLLTARMSLPEPTTGSERG